MNKETREKQKDSQLWRDYVGYWIVGLCNHLGATVTMTAAYDLMVKYEVTKTTVNNAPIMSESIDNENARECNMISTGAVLLACAIPSMFVKAIASFLPLCMNIRVAACCLLQVASYLIMVYADTRPMAYLGIGLTSCNIGLGEASFLSYTAFYHKNVLSTFSSGTGAAALLGALYYAGLRSIGFTTDHTVFSLLLVPIVEALTFWLLLRKPQPAYSVDYVQASDTDDMEKSLTSDSAKDDYMQNHIILQPDNNNLKLKNESEQSFGFIEKLKYLPSLAKYTVPLALVYFLEFLINQGMYELVYFPNIWLDHAAQYRWYMADYHIAVFLSRSSVNVIQIPYLWLFVIIQTVNIIFFTFEALYLFVPSIWIVLSVIFVEGLIGGSSYVNVFYRMSNEIEKHKLHFSFGVVVVFDVVGIVIAGLLAIPVHNAICKLPILK